VILVTGATGFLGKRVCRKLDTLGYPYHRTSLSLGADLRDLSTAIDLFAAVQPDKVLNCATYVGGIQFGLKYPADIFRVNMPLIANILEAAHLAGVKRIVNPISNCVYPARLSLFTEAEIWDGPLHDSVMVYGLLRKLSWAGSWAYARQHGLDTVNIVLSNMYGPEDHFDAERSHALSALVKKFADAERRQEPEVVVWGTGRPVREWLYVDDGAEAMVRALDCSPTLDPVNIGVAQGISIGDLAVLIARRVGYTGKIVFDASKADGAPHKTVDGSRGQVLLGGWRPPTALDRGIDQTVSWYLDHEENGR
jgi:GDP-L-fucose synthase